MSEPRKRSRGATQITTDKDGQPTAPDPAPQPQPVQAKPTLEGFIKEHDKLLAAMAILSGLAAFMKDLQVVGGYLSFVFTALTVLVWFELLTKFPKHTGTSRLVWFENLLTISVLGLVIYLVGEWLIFARGARLGLVFAMLPLLIYPTLWASIKLNSRLWLNRFEPRGEGDRLMIYLALVVPAAVVAYAVASLVAAPVASVLNSVQPPPASPRPAHLSTPTPSPVPSTP
jgi:hypothetical protein